MPIKQVTCAVCGQLVNKSQTCSLGEGRRACKTHEEARFAANRNRHHEVQHHELNCSRIQQAASKWRPRNHNPLKPSPLLTLLALQELGDRGGRTCVKCGTHNWGLSLLMLSMSRAIKNNFSAPTPKLDPLNEHELTNLLRLAADALIYNPLLTDVEISIIRMMIEQQTEFELSGLATGTLRKDQDAFRRHLTPVQGQHLCFACLGRLTPDPGPRPLLATFQAQEKNPSASLVLAARLSILVALFVCAPDTSKQAAQITRWLQRSATRPTNYLNEVVYRMFRGLEEAARGSNAP